MTAEAGGNAPRGRYAPSPTGEVHLGNASTSLVAWRLLDCGTGTFLPIAGMTMAAAAAFFTLLWSWLFNKAPNPVYAVLMMKGILIFPFLFALVDWAENLGFLFVIFSYPAEHPTIGNVAGTLKKIKPFIEGAILALTLAFAVTTAWRRQKR